MGRLDGLGLDLGLSLGRSLLGVLGWNLFGVNLGGSKLWLGLPGLQVGLGLEGFLLEEGLVDQGFLLRRRRRLAGFLGLETRGQGVLGLETWSPVGHFESLLPHEGRRSARGLLGQEGRQRVRV